MERPACRDIPTRSSAKCVRRVRGTTLYSARLASLAFTSAAEHCRALRYVRKALPAPPRRVDNNGHSQ